jgi:hypothetical protein
MIGIIGIRSKYYVGWILGEAAVIGSGQAYNGYNEDTKEHKFDRFYSIRIHYIEFGVFMPVVTENWNHSTTVWLKRYIYFRMNRLINRELALYLTYTVSAFWHGFYPSYLGVFIFYALYTETHKELYKICCKYPKLGSPVVLIFVYILTFLGGAHIGTSFTLLLLTNIKHFLHAIYWIPLFYIALFIFLKVTRKVVYMIVAFSKSSKKEQTPEKKEVPSIPWDITLYEIFSKPNEATKINHRN